MSSPRIDRALISVSDKEGVVEFAKQLVELGVEIYSTGGTATAMREAGISVVDVADYTNFPEMMDGRLKTLHPKIFGGLLCRRDNQLDMEAIAEHGIQSFELIAVNLYPFQATVANPDVTMPQAIEKIDIGGPSLVRAAAKNFKYVTVATSPRQYDSIIAEVKSNRTTSDELRLKLAKEAFAHTAQYDAAIAEYFLKQTPDDTSGKTESKEDLFPESINLDLKRQANLRYGENPHQQAAVYRLPVVSGANVLSATQLNGKELSYNNLMDADAALFIARSLPGCGVSVIKHSNPCGAASASTVAEATKKAMDGDPISAFGSILGFNQEVDEETASYLATPNLFVEAIVAPSFTEASLEILTTKPKWKNNVRLLAVGSLEVAPQPLHYRHIDGGLLVQESDFSADQFEDWKVVTKVEPTDEQMEELRFAWSVVKHVKSNAIVLCRNRMLVGAGAGQMSRVDSVQISIRKAADRAEGSVLASDAFFPFPDSIHSAAKAGIAAFIEPGGSRKDDEVIAACDELGLPMVFTGRRHFRH